MDGTIGEIRLFAGNFAPKNWAFCSGQLLAITSNTALFSILGTTYGGNGQTTFALPNLSSRTAIGVGQGAGLPYYELGEVLGTENVTLAQSNLPLHTHSVACNNTAGSGSLNNPNGAYPGTGPVNRSTGQSVNNRYATTHDSSMAIGAVLPAGGSMPLSIVQPVLCLNYIICMFGLFPSRN